MNADQIKTNKRLPKKAGSNGNSKLFNAENLRLAAAFLLIFFAVYSSSPARGFVSSLPLLFAASVIASFIYDEPLRNSAFAAASALIILVADTADIRYSAVFAVGCGLYCFAVSLCCRLFKKAISGKSTGGWIILLCCAVISAALIATQMLLLGTPWGNVDAADSVKAYTEEKYPNEKFTSYRAGYDVTSGLYTVRVFYDYKDTSIDSRIKVLEHGFEDGYFLDTVYSLSSLRSYSLIAVLQNNIHSESFVVTCAPFLGKAGDYTPLTTLPEDGDDDRYFGDMAFNITFSFETPDRASFFEACARYAAIIEGDGCKYGAITFYGGEKGERMFCLRLLPGTVPTADDVMECSGDGSDYVEFDRSR